MKDFLQLVRRHLISASIPVTKAIGKFHAPFAHKAINGLHYYDAVEILEPGDVLLTHTEGELTNVFIPGFWGHGAIYVGNGWVVEAIGEGVVKTDLVTFMTRKDAIAIMRPLFASQDERDDAAHWSEEQIGAPYDYDFTSGNKAFYCFELTFAAYQEATHSESPWTLRESLGVPTVLGDDFELAKDKWKKVWDSRLFIIERHAGRAVLVPTGPEVAPLKLSA